MQESVPAGKWDLPLVLLLTREGRVVKGKKNMHCDIGSGHAEHHHLDGKEMQEKAVPLKWRHTAIFSLLYIKGRAVILQNVWS